LDELNKRAEDPNLWGNPQQAQKVMRQRQALERSMAGYRKLERDLDDAVTLIELGETEDDKASVDEGEASLKKLADEARRQEVEALLSGEADGNDTYVEVHAGAGGTESQDWAEMLARMYTRWSEDHDYKVALVEQSAGEEAGIKSATLLIKGESAYGWLKTESGVHRLVRISPYDSAKRRHTSFASLYVWPELPEDVDIVIEDKDLRVDTYRSSGAGGQHVNVTDSAIRLTHLPTGIVVSCQNERSQHKNRASAMKVLKSRLYDLKLKEQQAAMDKLGGEKKEIGFGSQIRSYVMQPYQMVKDLRSRHTTGDVQGVLDGDLDPFIKAYLMQKASGTLGQPAGDDDE
jgi:peptide chain release factor 2